MKQFFLECKAQPREWIDCKRKRTHKRLIIKQLKKGKKLAIACGAEKTALAMAKTIKKKFPELKLICVTGNNHEEKEELFQLKAKNQGSFLISMGFFPFKLKKGTC